MTAVTPAILSALAEGVTAITPNRRLARQLLRDFDRAQLASGRRTWPTASVLPYATWIETLWQQHADAVGDTAAGTLLTQAQSSHLWRSIVDAGQPILLDPGGAARLAGDAWRLVHAWGAGGASWRAWRQEDADVDDPAIFAAWAESYARELRRSGAVDAAQLPDLLAQGARHLDCASLRTMFVGFLEHTPQQQRLHAALIAAGADVRFAESLPARTPTAMRATAANSRDELVIALSWARDLVLATPHSRIGIVIENLGEWRDEVVLLADEVLCPELAMAASLTTRRPYEISLGTALAETPLVASALELIASGRGKSGGGGRGRTVAFALPVRQRQRVVETRADRARLARGRAKRSDARRRYRCGGASCTRTRCALATRPRCTQQGCERVAPGLGRHLAGVAGGSGVAWFAQAGQRRTSGAGSVGVRARRFCTPRRRRATARSHRRPAHAPQQ